MIEAAARGALRDLTAVRHYEPGKPSEIVVEFTRTDAFDEHRRKPVLTVVGDRRVASRANEWWVVDSAT